MCTTQTGGDPSCRLEVSSSHWRECNTYGIRGQVRFDINDSSASVSVSTQHPTLIVWVWSGVGTL